MRPARSAPSIFGGRSPMAPAYYQCRSAQIWIDALDRRHRRSTGTVGHRATPTQTDQQAVATPSRYQPNVAWTRALVTPPAHYREAGSRLVGNCS